MSARARPAILSVVAKSKTGKTTLLERLVPELKRNGLKLALVKHHHHPSSFDTPGKDTYRLADAGADVVIGASAVQLAIFTRLHEPLDLEEALSQATPDVDLVLTEGFKSGPFPKIEVHRSARSDDLLCTTDELVALVTDRSWALDVPQFHLDDIAGLAAFLVDWLG